jgi:hypothetical protein
VTKTASDEYVFRAVPLRNVELTAPYFHSGKVWNLEQAVAIVSVAQLGKELTPQKTSDIAAFLRTLTGEQPRVELPLLNTSTAQTPGPEPLVKNSLEKGDAVEKQNSLRRAGLPRQGKTYAIPSRPDSAAGSDDPLIISPNR